MLNPLTNAAIAAERRDYPQRSHYAAQSTAFPLGLLSDRQYELLVHGLLIEEDRQLNRWNDIFLLPVGADKGRDIVLTHGGGVAVIVQCKRNSRPLGPNEITREVLKFCLNAIRHPEIFPRGDNPSYHLWAAGGLTEAARLIFESLESSERHFGTVSRIDVDAARKGYQKLKASKIEIEAENEAQSAIALAKCLQLTYFGPEKIHPLIAKHADVRRFHFRGPEDRPVRASIEQIEMLAAKNRREVLEGLRSAKDPYVTRTGLDRHFEDFLSANCKIFALTGGSGQGKSTWSARLIDTPPPGFTVDVISSADILASDQNFVETLHRKLISGRMAHIPTEDLQQAVWEWLDADNRIIVIDGLDRTRAEALETLPRWLDTSISQIRDVPTKLVLTSRLESWVTLSKQCQRVEGQLFPQPEDGKNNAVSMVLDAVTDVEREALYDAYGIDTDRERGRKLTTPSLIRQLARLQTSVPGQVVTRLDVIDAEISEIGKELRPKIGPTAVTLTFERLAESLLDATDGWVSLKTFLPPNPSLQSGVDMLIERDRATLQDTDFRLQSDDVIETLMSRALDVSSVLERLAGRRADPLFIGAVAMFIATLERKDLAAGTKVLKSIAASGAGPLQRLNVVFRAMLEVQEPEPYVDGLNIALSGWAEKNHLLWATGFLEFVSQVALPTAMLLEVLWPLAVNEDSEDWRDLYWFSPKGSGRFFSPFAQAMSALVARDPSGALDGILARFGKGRESVETVARFLLREAATLVPELALDRSWGTMPTSNGAFSIVVQSVPGPALRFVAGKHAERPDLKHFLVRQAYDLSTSRRPTQRPDKISRDVIAAVMDKMLIVESDPMLRALLLIGRLGASPDEGLQSELTECWNEVPIEAFWEAFQLLGSGRVGLLRDFLQQHESARVKSDIVRYFVLEKLLPGEIPDLVSAFDLYRTIGSDEEKSVGRATEQLLNMTTNEDDFDTADLQILDDFCMMLARSANDASREELTYHAASVADEDNGFDAKRRDRLLDMLIENETGGNIGTLCWKMSDSWPHRPENLKRVLRLIERCGEDPVLGYLRENAISPVTMPEFVMALEKALDRRAAAVSLSGT